MEDKKIDGRVRRTKKLLREGLIQLMQEKSIKKISVRELSDLVEINRGTFYLHYKDVFDLTREIEEELFEEFEEITNSHQQKRDLNSDVDGYFQDNIYQFIVDVCCFLEKNKRMCSTLLGPNGDLDFILKLKSSINEKCFKEFLKNERTAAFIDMFDYIYAYFETGVIGIIGHWLRDESPDRKTPEEVAKILEQLFLYGISFASGKKGV